MRLNNKGFTLLEVIVTAGIISFIAVAMASGVIHFIKLNAKTKISGVTYKQANNVFENLKSNLRDYQINFNPNPDTKDSMLNVATLPLAWDASTLTTVANCKDCPGRLGYIVQPTTEKGLYLLTVRMTHETWGDGNYKDFKAYLAFK